MLPPVNAVDGNLLVWDTFATGFLARPLGGILFGHFGDRMGRKWPVFQAVPRKPVIALTVGRSDIATVA